MCYDLPQEMHTELHETHTLRTVSTIEFFRLCRTKETIQGYVCKLLRSALLTCFSALNISLISPCLASGFALIGTGYEFPACSSLFATAYVFPGLELILCFPALATNYVFPRFSPVTVSLTHLARASCFPPLSAVTFSHT